MNSCMLSRPIAVAKPIRNKGFVSPTRALNGAGFFGRHGPITRSLSSRVRGVRASMVESYESSSNFIKRMEQAWLISQVILFLFFLIFFRQNGKFVTSGF